jgi:hypothetical protein
MVGQSIAKTQRIERVLLQSSSQRVYVLQRTVQSVRCPRVVLEQENAFFFLRFLIFCLVTHSRTHQLSMNSTPFIH